MGNAENANAVGFHSKITALPFGTASCIIICESENFIHIKSQYAKNKKNR